MKAFYWAILAALVWGIAPVLEKTGLKTVQLTHGIFLRSSGIILGVTVIAFCYPGIFKSIVKYDIKSIVFIVISGIMASIVGQFFFYNALKLGEASQVVPIAASFPLVTFIISIFILNEEFTISKVMGITFILTGIYLLK